MKNLTNLIVIGILLFGLGCKCSSFLNKNQAENVATNVETPSSSPDKNGKTDIDVSAPSGTNDADNRTPLSPSVTDDAMLETGTYTGRAHNETVNADGDIMVRIISITKEGVIKGYFEASNGLEGEGELAGAYDKNTGKVSLFGKTTDGQGVIVSGTYENGTIDATYIIGNKQVGVQKGSFSVSK